MKEWEEYDAFKIKEGHIYLFTDVDYLGNTAHTRPILIAKVLNERQAFLGFKLTSMTRDFDKYSYKLQDWQEAQLKRESSIRCDKPLFLSLSTIQHFNAGRSDERLSEIGEISAHDMQAVAQLYSAYCDQMQTISKQILDNSTKETVAVIRSIEKYGNGDSSSELKIYMNADEAAEEWKKTHPTKSKVIRDGKLMNKVIDYEKGYIKVGPDGSINENEIKVIARKNYDSFQSEKKRGR